MALSIRHRWGVLTDLHLAATGTDDTRWHNAVRRGHSRDLTSSAIALLQGQEIERVILLGDLSDTADADDYDHLLAGLADAGMRGWLVPGNHDCTPQNPDALTTALAKRPTDVVVPTEQGERVDGVVVATGSLAPHPTNADPFTLRLELPDSSPDLMVVLTHFPILDLSETLAAEGLRDAGNLANRAGLATTLTDWPGPVLVLHGHLHVRGHAICGNVLQLAFASLAEQPHDTATLDISVDADTDRPRIVVRRHAHTLWPSSPALRRALLDPDETEYTWTADAWLPGESS